LTGVNATLRSRRWHRAHIFIGCALAGLASQHGCNQDRVCAGSFSRGERACAWPGAGWRRAEHIGKPRTAIPNRNLQTAILLAAICHARHIIDATDCDERTPSDRYKLALVAGGNGGGGMRRFLAEHLGVFDPDDIRILTVAFDEAWEAVQASGPIYSRADAEMARAILAKHIIAAARTASMTRVGYAMALWWPWLNQTCELSRVRRRKH
jgi:hypothetical protein